MNLYRQFKKHFWVVTTIVIIYSLVFLPNSVSGDGGVLPLTYTWLHQPSQNAIVAWNGTEEILILSTNIMSGVNATAIQILPFPSYPEIKEGNESSFYKIANLIGGVAYKYAPEWFGAPLAVGAGIEILFTTQIGVHNLTVLRVNDFEEFTLFLKDLLGQRNQSLLVLFDELFPNFENIASNYVKQNIKYFVIDDIETKSNLRTVKPIIYRFNTSYLYYPMVMTSMIFDFMPKEQEMKYYYYTISINIFTITQGLPRDEHVIKNGFWRRTLLEVDRNTLGDINPDVGELFYDKSWLGSYSATVSLTKAKTSSVFAQDFIIKETYAPLAWGWIINTVIICGIILTTILGIYLLYLVRGIHKRFKR